jgi:hypothetical protein
MLDAEQCGRYARKFLMRSRQMTNPETRAAMIGIAVYWTQLAAKAADRSPSVDQEQYADGANSSSPSPKQELSQQAQLSSFVNNQSIHRPPQLETKSK